MRIKRKRMKAKRLRKKRVTSEHAVLFGMHFGVCKTLHRVTVVEYGVF